MTAWQYTLRLADVFNDDELAFEQWRDRIVGRIRTAPFYTDTDDDLVQIVDELADVDSTRYFDLVWDAFYDWCDDHRVWVDTH